MRSQGDRSPASRFNPPTNVFGSPRAAQSVPQSDSWSAGSSNSLNAGAASSLSAICVVVTGAAASTRQTQRIEDVHAFPGHIACDAASRSELVVPLVRDGALVGVFDLDSPVPARFDVHDQQGLETIARLFVESFA